MFDLNQLRCFVAVADELHFGRAAARLHMTQPPLTRQIQLLEHSIGTPLFSRTNRMVRLTPAGRSLLPEAHVILRLAEKARLSALRTGLGEAGRIVIGFTATAGYEFLPEMLGRLRRTLPDIDLELREMVSRLQIEALESGQLDVGLLRRLPADRDDLDSVCVARETLVAALPLDHPLARRPSIHLRDFNGRPLVMYSPDDAQYFHELVRHVFARVGARPDYGQYVSQIHSMLAVVRSGLGAALVPEAGSRQACEGVVFREVGGIDPVKLVELHLAWKIGNDNPALMKALPLLQNIGIRRLPLTLAD
ncbi:LysR family transcriptional regulator [Paraburkholderia caballeronis]|uniref:LysR family transcriptional regulator n=1 Tax=Paraburkholderia caballeronis TaxID=416943 RepID=UPI0010656C71|nr:LysR family transcriptional regulator [Paraburkholderia caballeronis]